MKNILVGTDGSEASFRAVTLAAQVAGTMSAELHVLTITRPRDYEHDDHSGSLGQPPDRYVDLPAQLEAEVAATLGRCGEIAKSYKVIRLHQKNPVALDVALELLDYIRDNQIDLVVVGRRGRSQLAGLLLGSVSHKLATLAPCPVLIA
jgi:nucleotide-binding universal stress UspA family protein